MATNDANTGEQRIFPRVNRLFYVSYLAKTGETVRTPVSLGMTVDISPAGVGMEVYKELAVGSIMEMEIDLEDCELPVRGKIVHVNARGDGDYVIGVQFDEPQELLATKATP